MNDLIYEVKLSRESIAMIIKLLHDKKRNGSLNYNEQRMMEVMCLALGDTIKPE